MRATAVLVLLLVIIICLGCSDEKSSFMSNVKYVISTSGNYYYTDNYTVEDGFVVLKDWVVGGYRAVNHSVIRLGKGQIESIQDWQ